MISKTYTVTNIWLEAFLITIEADMNKSLPTIEIVWMADISVKEAKERIRSSFRNLDIQLPNKKIIINLSPSNIKKSWNRYDLPIAVGILDLVLDNIDKNILEKSIFIWELWLDGKIKPVEWIIPVIIKWKQDNFKYVFVSEDNKYEASYIQWINIISVKNLKELILYLIWEKQLEFVKAKKLEEDHRYDIDFSDIKWNFLQKQALMIWAAWMHNILMIWAPWSWKTMLAKAIKWILPPMMEDEILETSTIYSVKWLLSKENPIVLSRPFR